MEGGGGLRGEGAGKTSCRGMVVGEGKGRVGGIAEGTGEREGGPEQVNTLSPPQFAQNCQGNPKPIAPLAQTCTCVLKPQRCGSQPQAPHTLSVVLLLL